MQSKSAPYTRTAAFPSTGNLKDARKRRESKTVTSCGTVERRTLLRRSSYSHCETVAAGVARREWRIQALCGLLYIQKTFAVELCRALVQPHPLICVRWFAGGRELPGRLPTYMARREMGSKQTQETVLWKKKFKISVILINILYRSCCAGYIIIIIID